MQRSSVSSEQEEEQLPKLSVFPLVLMSEQRFQAVFAVFFLLLRNRMDVTFLVPKLRLKSRAFCLKVKQNKELFRTT